MSNVITPMSLDKLKCFFDKEAIDTIKYFISKSVFAQPELMVGQLTNPIQVPKEHIEQWVVQALNVTPVGAGSFPVDVISSDGWGADVKMLSCKVKDDKLATGESGETSLCGKFTGICSDLDTLFLDEDYNKIVKGFKNIYSKKITSVMKEKNLSHIYYFIVLRAGLKFYLCGMDVNVANIEKVKYLRNTNQNVWTKNFMEERYGSIRVYKSKKRMELRLRPKQWYQENLLYEFSLQGDVLVKGIKDIMKMNNNDKSESLRQHINYLIDVNF